jgi:hypothetical protein
VCGALEAVSAVSFYSQKDYFLISHQVYDVFKVWPQIQFLFD